MHLCIICAQTHDLLDQSQGWLANRVVRWQLFLGTRHLNTVPGGMKQISYKLLIQSHFKTHQILSSGRTYVYILMDTAILNVEQQHKPELLLE